jgi:pimeloyl-ACP methyl ester carboxylesterase
MDHFTAPDGTRLAYDDRGQGLPLLCLAGLTRTMGDFDDVMPHLPACRVIRLDWRGRGASAWTGAATYTVPTEARDALALLDHLGVARAAILGTSRGGIVGLWLAAQAPGRLLGLCLNDIGPVTETAGIDRILAYLGRKPRFRSHAEMAAALPGLNPGFDGVPPARWLAEARRHWRETPEGLAITYDPELAEAFRAAYARPSGDLWPLFDAAAGMPVAVIRGANSDLLSRATLAEMIRRRPDLIAAEVPGRAHIPFLDEPEAVAAIRSFLAAAATAAGAAP